VAADRLRQDVFGAGASCRRYGGPILCARDVALDGGEPVTIAAALADFAPDRVLTGAAVEPILSFGWGRDPASGDFLSEGPRATLLAKVPASGPFTLRMTLQGIARKAGEARPIVIQVGEGAPVAVDLADLTSTTISVPVTAAQIGSGILRVAFDIFRPIDPAHRGLSLPVNRAGIRIEKIELSTTAG